MIKTAIIFTWLVGLSASWAQAQTNIITENTAQGIQVHASFQGFTVTNVSTEKGIFQKLVLPGEGFSHDVGAPQLPVARFEIEIPTERARIVMSGQKSNWTQLKTNQSLRIVPAQESTVKLPGVKAPFALNVSLYQSAEVAANQLVRIVHVGSVRGHQIASIEISPVKYAPLTGTAQILEHVEFMIQSEAPLKNSDIQPSRAMDQLNSQTILNYSVSKAAARDRLLVLVAPTFVNDPMLQKLLALKQSRGLDLAVAQAADYGKTPASIRQFIQKNYQLAAQASSLSYVLIVGDTNQIPAYQSEQYTDNYYAAIDKLAYEGDQAYRDVAIGRLPAKTSAELKVMIDKIIKYETNSFQDTSWQKRVAWLGTDDKYEVAEGTHNYVIDSYTKNLGYTGIFPTAQEAGGDKLYAITNNATTENVQKSMNDGRAFIVYSGHGSEDQWVGPHVGSSEIAALNHPDALPYVMGFACLTNSFANESDSFSKMWMKNPRGAIAYFGASNYSYWDEDDILERVFFDGLFKEKIKAAGLVNNFGLDGVRKQYSGEGRTVYYYEIYNLMGDPTLELR